MVSHFVADDPEVDIKKRISKTEFLVMVEEETKKWSMHQPELSEELRIRMSNMRDDTLSIGRCGSIINSGLNDAMINTTKQPIKANYWNRSKEFPNIAGLLARLKAIQKEEKPAFSK